MLLLVGALTGGACWRLESSSLKTLTWSLLLLETGLLLLIGGLTAGGLVSTCFDLLETWFVLCSGDLIEFRWRL